MTGKEPHARLLPGSARLHPPPASLAGFRSLWPGSAHLAQGDGAGGQADEPPFAAVGVLREGKLHRERLDDVLDLRRAVLRHELAHQPVRGESRVWACPAAPSPPGSPLPARPTPRSLLDLQCRHLPLLVQLVVQGAHDAGRQRRKIFLRIHRGRRRLRLPGGGHVGCHMTPRLLLPGQLQPKRASLPA